MSDRRDVSQDALFSMIKTVVRHSAVYGFFDMLGKATALILVPIYVRVMTPADYGTLEIFIVSGILLLTLLTLGFNSAIVRFYSTAPEGDERREYFRTGITLVVLVAGVLGLVAMAFAPMLSRMFFDDATRTVHWRVLIATVAIDTVAAMFMALFRAQERPFRYSAVNLGRVLTILILNVVLVGVLKMGVKGALLGNLVGALLGFSVAFWLARAEFGFSISRPHLGRLAGFGFPLVVNGVGVSVVMASADRYFLKAYSTLTEVGIYSLGYKVGMIMSVLVSAFVVAWLPIMFRIGRSEDARAIFSRVITYYLLATGCVLLVVGSYRYELVELLAKPEYRDSARVVVFVLASYALQGLYYIATVGVILTDRTRWVSLVAALGAVTNLTLNFVLIPRYGMMGAAWATVLSYLFLAILMKLIAERHYAIPLESRRLVTLIGLGAGILALNGEVFGHGTALSAFLKFVSLAAFPGLLLATGFFHSDEIIRFRAFLLRLGRRGGGGLK